MKKKMIIELFIYIIVVAVSITLLLTGKQEEKPVQINPDFKLADRKGEQP